MANSSKAVLLLCAMAGVWGPGVGFGSLPSRSAAPSCITNSKQPTEVPPINPVNTNKEQTASQLSLTKDISAQIYGFIDSQVDIYALYFTGKLFDTYIKILKHCLAQNAPTLDEFLRRVQLVNLDRDTIIEKLNGFATSGFATVPSCKQIQTIVTLFLRGCSGSAELDAQRQLQVVVGSFITRPGGDVSEALWDLLLIITRTTSNPIEVNIRYDEGRTLLHLAALYGYTEIVRLLLEKGAEVDVVDILNNQPLQLAAKYGHVDAMRLLFEKGAKASIADVDGRQPLHGAARYGHVDAMRLLFEKRAQVDVKNNNYRQALHYATVGGHVDAMNLLLENRAEIDAKDNNGQQPLHIAAERGCIEVARFLIFHRAEIKAEDNAGQTPLDIAIANGHAEVGRLLTA